MNVLFLILSALASASTPATIHADVARVRSAPTTGAEIEARLRINTPVTVLEEKDGWSRIRMTDRPESYPIEGWVASSLLGEGTLTTTDVSRAAEASETDKDRAKWEGRAAAIAGEPRGHHVYVAVCRAIENAARTEPSKSRAELVGRWSAGDGFEDMTSSGTWSEAPDELQPVAAWVGSLPWRSVGENRHLSHWETVETGLVMSGTPFPAPFLTELWNEDAGSAYKPGGSEMGGGEYIVVLGPCNNPGDVLATAPLTGVDPAAVGMSDAISTVSLLEPIHSGTVYGMNVSRPDKDASLKSVMVSFPWEYGSCGESHAAPASNFVLMNGETILSIVGAGMAPSRGTHPEHVGSPSWYRLDFAGETRMLGVMKAKWGYGTGASLVMVEPDFTKATDMTVTLESYGC